MRTLEQLDADAPILQKTVELYKEFYGYLKLFPKKDQYLLGKRCEDDMLAFMEYVLIAVGLPKDRKLRLLEAANGKFDTLKVLLRIARELRMIDNKNIFRLKRRYGRSARCLAGG